MTTANKYHENDIVNATVINSLDFYIESTKERRIQAIEDMNKKIKIQKENIAEAELFLKAAEIFLKLI